MKHFNVCTKVHLPFKLVTERVAFLGMSGTGKSYAATKVAEEFLEAGAQLVYVDPVGIGYGLRIGADGKKGGYPVYVFGGDHADFPVTSKMGAVIAETIVTSGISSVLDISDFTLGQQTEFLIDFAEALWQLKKRNRNPLHVFWEECHLFIPQDRAPEPKAATLLNRIERLIRIGRQRGVGSSMISQFPQSIHKRCLNNAEVVFAFACSAKHERKAISEWFDSNVSEARFDFHNERDITIEGALPRLETGQCILASRRLLKVCEVVRVHAKCTFDSSDTPEFGGKTKRTPALRTVDVEKLKGALTEALEAAKANDPKLLREENERLKGELAKVLHAKTQTTRAEAVPEYIALQDKYEKLRASKAKEMQRAVRGLDKSVGEHAGKQVNSVQNGFKLVGKMHDILAALYAGPLSADDLATVIGMKPGTGGYNNYVRDMKAVGLIVPNADGQLQLTAEGMKLAPGDKLYSRTLDDALVRHGSNIVGKMKDMVEVVRVHGPLMKETIQEKVGMAPNTGGANNYVRDLVGRGIFVKDDEDTDQYYINPVLAQKNHPEVA
ncbi:MAG: ATP-binding protein [Salinibacterium sp.]|nr:MAG: ATP-binding protein [Salinibacterium sp.]